MACFLNLLHKNLAVEISDRDFAVNRLVGCIESARVRIVVVVSMATLDWLSVLWD